MDRGEKGRRRFGVPKFDAAGGRWIGANLVVLIGYCVLGLAVSRFFARYGLFPAPIWLPASIGVVAAMAGGLRVFPGLFAGSLIINYLVFDPPLAEALMISVTNSLGPIAGAALARRFRPRAGLFHRLSGVAIFIGCNVLLHPALTATGGTLALAIFQPIGTHQLPAIWLNWWLSDSGGALYFAPALLLWLKIEPEALPQAHAPDRYAFLVWAGVAAVAVALFALLPIQTPVRLVLPFLLVIPLSWIALRTSLRAAYSLVSLVSVVACAFTVAGFGPFQGQDLVNPLQLVGALVVLVSLNVLTVVALVAERREAEETSKVKSMFLASMSHDLRTPLNSIIGFAEMMRDETWGPIGNERYRGYVGDIRASGLLLQAIINDLLDLSKIEAGKRDLKCETLDGRKLAEECRAILKPKADEKGIAISIEAGARAPVYADDLALRQILINLLSNAVKFTPAGGHVAVRILSLGGGTAVEVADTGVGMDEKGIAKALEPYGQIGEPVGAGDRGTGLGLPIALRLTELHGGRLSIVSAPGQGTTVRATFPMPRGDGGRK